MFKRTRSLSAVIALAALASAPDPAFADDADRGRSHGPAAADSRRATSTVEYYGVPLAAPVYFVNFMLLYMANPNQAANMPAYRSPLPGELSDCLQLNPKGCDYEDFALSFDDDASGDQRCGWPGKCRTDPRWQRFAPRLARSADQVNEPLGLERAHWLAEQLHMDKAMILTDREYQCTIGTPPREIIRETIVACLGNLTNSNGNTNIPLASYGLAITDDYDPDVPAGYVQSLCAPDASCLEFNKLFVGPLEDIARNCGWGAKFERLLANTPLPEFIVQGGDCQALGGTGDGGACIVEPVCLGR